MHPRSTSHVMRTILFLSGAALLAVLAFATLSGCGNKESNDQPAAEPVVKKVDHITVSCTDPQALFDTLTQTLGLPVAWPFSTYPGFSTGGVVMGNVNMETIKFEGEPPGQQMPPFTFVYGIVFEPYPLDQVVPELEARGANPGQPRDQMREINGQQVKMWTDVTLQALCTKSYIVYLVDYSEQAKAALTANAVTGPLGGLGLTGVKEIEIQSTQPDQTRQLWETVFAPAPMSADGVQAYGSGPAVRISQGSQDFIEGLVLQVASLQTARDFLTSLGMLGNATATELTINPAAVQGLDIRLVEAPAK